MQQLMLALPFARSLGTRDCSLSQGARKASNSQSGGSEQRYGAGTDRFLDCLRFVIAIQIMFPVANVRELQRQALTMKTMKEELICVFPRNLAKIRQNLGIF